MAQLVRSVLFRTKVIDTAAGMFIGLIALAMLLYPGGTWWAPERVGHAFWENFLCDLLHQKSLSGQVNVRSARLALWAIILLVVGIIAAFSLAPEVIPSRKNLGRKLARFGSIGAVLLMGAPLVPSDLHPLLHSNAVVFGGLPTFVSFAVFVGAILSEPAIARPMRAVSLGLLVLTAIAMALYTWTAFLHGPSLRILPAIERIANILLLLWLVLLARFVRKRLIAAYLVLANRNVASDVRQ